MSDNKGDSLLKILVGALIGGIAGIFFAPKTGEHLRQDLSDDLDEYLKKVRATRDNFVNETEKTAEEIRSKADQISAFIDKYGENAVQESVEKIEAEINAFKSAIKAAMESYKKSKNTMKDSQKVADDIFVDFVNENTSEYEDESLPKKESMHRRPERKKL